jgi:hypothetical protein
MMLRSREPARKIVGTPVFAADARNDPGVAACRELSVLAAL